MSAQEEEPRKQEESAGESREEQGKTDKRKPPASTNDMLSTPNTDTFSERNPPRNRSKRNESSRTPWTDGLQTTPTWPTSLSSRRWTPRSPHSSGTLEPSSPSSTYPPGGPGILLKIRGISNQGLAHQGLPEKSATAIPR